jgi:tRNA(Arg) A34 adenosine deaminase TadA
MEEKNKFMLEAIKLAEQNLLNGNGGPFGAIVVKDGKIIGRGTNTVTSSNDPTAHAEMNAIRDACKNIDHFQLENCDVYTSCEPCPMCLGALYWARPSKIYYAANKTDAAKAGFDDSKIYKEFELSAKDRTIPNEQLLRERAVEVFDTWKNLAHKTEY